MANYRRSEIVSGAFIVLAVLVFTLFAFRVGGWNLFGFLEGETRTFRTLLPNVQTLEVGAKVAVGGRRVGRVTKIEVVSPDQRERFRGQFQQVWGIPWQDLAVAVGPRLENADNPPRVEVWFEVDKSEVEGKGQDAFRVSGPESRALLVQEGFLGPHFIELYSGPLEARSERKAVFGDDLKGIGTRDEPIPLVGMETGLMQLIQELAGGTIEELEGLLRKLNTQVLSDANVASISAGLDNLNQLLAEARELLSKRVDPLLDPNSLDGVHALVLRPLNQLLVQGNELLPAFIGDLRNTVTDKLNPTLDQGKTTLEVAQGTLQDARESLNRMTPNLEKILADLAVTTGNLEGRLNHLQGEIDRVVSDVVTLLRRTDGLVADVRPETMESLQSLRRTLWEVEMLSRKVRANPAVVLWGDEEKILSTWPSDPAALRRTGRAGPYQQRDENEKR